MYNIFAVSTIVNWQGASQLFYPSGVVTLQKRNGDSIMNIEKQIQKWLDAGDISPEQAQKMFSDVNQKSKEERFGKVIVAISAIGATLLGIGAILFVAANWEETPALMRVFILLGSDFGAYYLGYRFRYQKKNLPKVGASLFLLGAILFGANVFLIAQIYNINANSHVLALIWLMGILPLVYAFRSEAIAALASLLFFVWTGLFFFNDGFSNDNTIFVFPVFSLAAGVLLFGIGGMHYLKPGLIKVARIFRLAGVKVAMLSMFLLTFKPLTGGGGIHWFRIARPMENIPSQLRIGVVLFSILAILSMVVNLFFNPTRSKNNIYEHGIALGCFSFAFLFIFASTEHTSNAVLYNLLFGGLTLFLVYIGYQRLDLKIVNIGIFWLSVFVLAKYFDFFWGLLDRSLFFMVGGFILFLGGVALERKRRQIKEAVGISDAT